MINDREFKVGDLIINRVTGVVGRFLYVYQPTACELQIMVSAGGRLYHGPISTWMKF